MQIESFKVFCDLSETESFTKAAHINGITQSAVSQQVSSMERQFKCLLIERSKKKFRLTREGALLYESGRQIVQSFDLLQARLHEVSDVVSGTIRLATIYSIGLHDLPVYLKIFLKAFPAVNVHVEYQRSNQVYDDVLGGAVDLGLVAYPIKETRLEVIELWRDPMVMICHPAHSLARNRTVPIEALNQERFIAFEPDIPTRRALDKILQDHQVRVKTTMEFDNIETVKRAVEIEAGISVVPASTVVQETASRTIVAIPFDNLTLERPVAVIHRKDKILTPAIKQFLTVLRGGDVTRGAEPPPAAAATGRAVKMHRRVRGGAPG